jgi:DNA sulfur modification protein DndB
MPLSAVPSLFKFTDWVGFSPEDREQRVLDERRIPEIKHYILDNEDEYLFAAITASYKSQPVFEANDGGSGNIGILKMKFGDELIINDGQHRCAGISAALKENPNIGDHTISVLLFPYENKERVQQMFSDLNKNVVKTSKSLDILYDKRDKISAATLAALDQVPIFKELTEMGDVSLRSKSPKLFTLAALYDANRELLKGREDDDILENAGLLRDYWSVVATHMPDWNLVLTGRKSAIDLRAEKIASHSTVLRALGGLGLEIVKNDKWRDQLAQLETINWSKKNPDWDNVCIIANSVVSNRQARAATKAYIKNKLGLELTSGERRSVNKVAA